MIGDADRGDVPEETLALLRSWWAGDTVAHRSSRWRFAAVQPQTRPVQDPLEVWLGGRGPKALDRVGRIADGWLGAHVTPAEASHALQRIQAAAAAAGRELDPEHFGISIGYTRTELMPDTVAGLRQGDPRSTRTASLPSVHTGYVS